MYITKNPIIITSTFKIRPELGPDFMRWQAHCNSTIASANGFISLEFLSKSENSWVVVERFNTRENALSWQSSPECQQLKKQLASLVNQKEASEQIEEETAIQEGVTEVIIAEVSPGKEAAFTSFCSKIHQVEALFEGFRGVYIQSPKTSGSKYWITLLQFDTADHLDRWLSSKERHEVLKEGLPLVSSIETNRIVSPFAGWFSSIAKSEEMPSTWQQTMLVLLVLFPIVMLEIQYLSPLTAKLNHSLATFIGNTLSVLLIAFPCMPLAIRAFSFWLFPKPANRPLTVALGTALILVLYLIEILIFWNL